MSSIVDRLPPALRISIALFCPVSDLAALAAVCREWHALYSSDRCVRRVVFAHLLAHGVDPDIVGDRHATAAYQSCYVALAKTPLAACVHCERTFYPTVQPLLKCDCHVRHTGDYTWICDCVDPCNRQFDSLDLAKDSDWQTAETMLASLCRAPFEYPILTRDLGHVPLPHRVGCSLGPHETARRARSVGNTRKRDDWLAALTYRDARTVYEEVVVLHAAWRATPQPRDAQQAAAIFARMRTAALVGVTEAQNTLGCYLYEGCCVPVDHVAAFSWFDRAATGGRPEAMCNVAQMCAAGEGLPGTNHAAALAWYRKAAALDYPAAQFELGLHELRSGRIDSALDWLRRAAEQGTVPAQYSLGALFAEGRLVARDTKTAAAWFLRAANEGHSEAQAELGYLWTVDPDAKCPSAPLSSTLAVAASSDSLFVASFPASPLTAAPPPAPPHPPSPDSLAPSLTEDAAAEWHRRLQEGVRWTRKAAEQGNARAQTSLGCLLYSGLGCERDVQAAYAWWCKAAAQDDVFAQRNLASTLSAGARVDVDPQRVRAWLTARAAQGSPTASLLAARLDAAGIGLDAPDVRGALATLRKLAADFAETKGNDDDAAVGAFPDFRRLVGSEPTASVLRDDIAFDLAACLIALDSDATLAERREGVELYRQLAARGCPAAQNNLGCAHLSGVDGVLEADAHEAARLFAQAAEAGTVAMARVNVAVLHLIGRGVTQDTVRALADLTSLAADAHPVALLHMGRIHLLGLCGLPTLDGEAAACFQRLARTTTRLAVVQHLRGCLRLGLAHGTLSEVSAAYRSAIERDPDATRGDVVRMLVAFFRNLPLLPQ